MTLAVQVLVLAKPPVAGRVKTRLCPPLTHQEAARVAAAAIADTVDVVAQLPVERRVLVADGDLRAPGFETVQQVAGPLDQRLAAAFDEAAGHALPALLVGMDTPQMSVAVLTAAARAVARGADVLGPAADGGWWALGLARPDGALLRGVPTSRDDTCRLQLSRLRDAGLSPRLLPTLTDVDTAADAATVAASAPHTRFAAVVTELLSGSRGATTAGRS